MKTLSKLAVPLLIVVGVICLFIGLRPTGQEAGDGEQRASAAEASMVAARSSQPGPGTTSSGTGAAPSSRTSMPGPSPHTSTTSAPRQPSTGATVQVSEMDDNGPTMTTPAASDPTSKAVMAAATRFLTAYARPAAGVSTDQWWARVKPLLTSQAATDYAGTDPRTVPFTKVTGQPMIFPAVAGEGDSDLVTMVVMSTDAGVYTVHVRPVAPYQVTRITPPGR